MTLSNMTLLTHPAIGSQRLEFWTNNQTTWLITPPGEGIEGAVGDTLSLIPLFEDALGVRTMNLAYPLQNEDLHQGPARGVSNVFTSGNVEVLLNSGSLVATHTTGRA
jgi:thiamine pyrophosphokinase